MIVKNDSGLMRNFQLAFRLFHSIARSVFETVSLQTTQILGRDCGPLVLAGFTSGLESQIWALRVVEISRREIPKGAKRQPIFK
jgi:hypothetical protein